VLGVCLGCCHAQLRQRGATATPASAAGRRRRGRLHDVHGGQRPSKHVAVCGAGGRVCARGINSHPRCGGLVRPGEYST
jgi:hypothetical protein